MIADAAVIQGIPIDNLTMENAVKRIFSMIDEFKKDGQPRQVATVNVDFLVKTLSWGIKQPRHPELLDILRRADLVTADGMPVVWALKLLGSPIKMRVTGSDLVPRLAEYASKHNKSLYLLGGRDDTAMQAAELLKERYPGLRIAGVNAPRVHTEGQDLLWSETEDEFIIDHINSSKADILLIGFGNPKQELWFHRNRHQLKVPVSIGVGGTYEFIAGTVSRAPEWMQKNGLEWIYRIIQDPGRLWKRYFVGFFKFGLLIIPSVLYYQYLRIRAKLSVSEDLIAEQNSKDTIELFSGSFNVIKLPKRMDASSVEHLRFESDYDKLAASCLVMDFRETSFIDSKGLGFIISLWRKSENMKGMLYMINISPVILQFFRLNRLWDLFHSRVFQGLNEILEMIRSKNSKPLFYLVSEAKHKLSYLELVGRLDSSQISKLDMKALTEDIGDKNCILNLDKLSFVDSTGLILFLKLWKHVTHRNNSIILCSIPDNIMQTLRITKLANLFRTAADVSSAEVALEGEA